MKRNEWPVAFSAGVVGCPVTPEYFYARLKQADAVLLERKRQRSIFFPGEIEDSRLNLEKAVNHGEHGEHGEKSRANN